MNKSLLILMFCCLVLTEKELYAQQESATENFWQEPFEGVPDYYRQWKYPDFQFPEKLNDWKKERLEKRTPQRPGNAGEAAGRYSGEAKTIKSKNDFTGKQKWIYA